MSLTLYHYVHCPFCVRVRFSLGYLKQPYKSQVTSYDDEKTPISLIGKKMLPIMAFPGGAIGESLDIIAMVDKENKLKVKQVTSDENYKEFEEFIGKVSNLVHSLAMPYWMWTPEFTYEAREYFKKKKEVKRGPFNILVQNQKQFIAELSPLLEQIEIKLSPFYQSQDFRLHDILLASNLWGLYVVPEFQFSPKIHKYLQSVKETCHFNYHEDYWR